MNPDLAGHGIGRTVIALNRDAAAHIANERDSLEGQLVLEEFRPVFKPNEACGKDLRLGTGIDTTSAVVSDGKRS